MYVWFWLELILWAIEMMRQTMVNHSITLKSDHDWLLLAPYGILADVAHHRFSKKILTTARRAVYFQHSLLQFISQTHLRVSSEWKNNQCFPRGIQIFMISRTLFDDRRRKFARAIHLEAVQESQVAVQVSYGNCKGTVLTNQQTTGTTWQYVYGRITGSTVTVYHLLSSHNLNFFERRE